MFQTKVGYLLFNFKPCLCIFDLCYRYCYLQSPPPPPPHEPTKLKLAARSQIKPGCVLAGVVQKRGLGKGVNVGLRGCEGAKTQTLGGKSYQNRFAI